MLPWHLVSPEANYSSILAWRISWVEKPDGLQSMGLQRIRHTWVTNMFTFFQERKPPQLVGPWNQTHKSQSKDLILRNVSISDSIFGLLSFIFLNCFFFVFLFIFISWRLITLQYCSGFCHTLKWISHGFTCVPHPDPPSHLPLYPIPLGLPSAPGPSTCLMHPTWAGDLFHPW